MTSNQCPETPSHWEGYLDLPLQGNEVNNDKLQKVNIQIPKDPNIRTLIHIAKKREETQVVDKDQVRLFWNLHPKEQILAKPFGWHGSSAALARIF